MKTKIFFLIFFLLSSFYFPLSTLYAWVEPSDTSNIVAPVNTGATAQTKTGDFGTNGSLNAGNNLCIRGDCKSAWPSFSSSDTLQSVTARGNTTDRSLNTSSGINMGASQTFYAPGRMHVFGEENLYLLNRGTTYVSRAWGGSGNLSAEGSLSAGDSVCIRGDCRGNWGAYVYWVWNTYGGYGAYDLVSSDPGGTLTYLKQFCNYDSGYNNYNFTRDSAPRSTCAYIIWQALTPVYDITPFIIWTW